MRLLVLGNAVIDRAYAVERLPLPGETLLSHACKPEAGGKGLNQAVAAHRAGAPVRLVAAIGDDPGGHLIRSRLDAEGMDGEGLRGAMTATDESIVLVTPGGENAIVSTAAATLMAEDVEREIAALDAGDLLLMQGNLSQALTEQALQQARDRRVTTLLNTAPIAFGYVGLLDLADVVIANAIEAAALGPVTSTLVVTDGPRGARIRREGNTQVLPAREVAAVDTTGAGDVLCGVLAAGLALGMTLEDGVRWGMAVAALKVTRTGAFAGMPTAGEIRGLQP
jgi:ribokinase